MEEATFLKDLKSGNPEAFRKLVVQYQDRVISTCYRFLYNREDAEDIAQEVFIEVYKSIGSFRGEAKLSTWIYRITVAKSLDFIRKRRRKKRFAYIRNILGLEHKAEQVAAPQSDSPEVILEDRERSRILNQAIESLSENQRIAITLSKYEGFSGKEIAEIMGTSLSSVEALVHRAKKNLRKKLCDYYEKHL